MARHSKLALTKEGVKLASLASLSELHQNTRILSGEFWKHLIDRSIDDNDMVAARIIAERLLPQKLITDQGSGDSKVRPTITINVATLPGNKQGKVIDHDDAD